MRMRDAQLIRRIQAGDRTAADTLIERYYTAILRYCARHTPCTQTAEDLTQEVFLHLFRTIGSQRRRNHQTFPVPPDKEKRNNYRRTWQTHRRLLKLSKTVIWQSDCWQVCPRSSGKPYCSGMGKD